MQDVVLGDRYHLEDLLGEGGSGKTYRAWDEQLQIAVAIKVVGLRGAKDWKTIELFEREATILAQLQHPAIPRYLDFFRAEVAGEEAFCLVQEIAPGRSLTAWMESGYAFTEKELRQIATQILEILIYLQTFTPPIIHRDIKPQNLLRTDSGIISLVDFGAVRDTYHLTITGGSTIVGTYGYMAPEQFRGQAVLATDLYGLGATLLYLKSGQDPADFPVQQMKIEFRDRVKFSLRFADWLEGLLQPIPEDRYSHAAQTLLYLQDNAPARLPRPKRLIAHISRQGKTLEIVIPPIWLATRRSKQTLMLVFPLVVVEIFYIWLMLAATAPLWMYLLFLGVAIPLAPWIASNLWQYLNGVMFPAKITIDKNRNIRVIKKNIFFTEDNIINNLHRVDCPQTGVLQMRGGIEFQTIEQEFSHNDRTDLVTKFYTWGKYLDYAEQRWLMGEITEHLQSLESPSLCSPLSTV